MSYRLLIVEDSLEHLEAMSDFYHEEGAGIWEVVTASDGNDALWKENITIVILKPFSKLSTMLLSVVFSTLFIPDMLTTLCLLLSTLRKQLSTIAKSCQLL